MENFDDYVLYVWGSEEKNSKLALDEAPPEIKVVDVRSLSHAETPQWLDGVPTLLHVEKKEIFYGADALDLLADLRNMPAPQKQARKPPPHMPAHMRYMNPDVKETGSSEQRGLPPPMREEPVRTRGNQPRSQPQDHGLPPLDRYGRSDVLPPPAVPADPRAGPRREQKVGGDSLKNTVDEIMKRRQQMMEVNQQRAPPTQLPSMPADS